MSRLMLVLPISARECGSTRQNNPDLSILAELAVDFNKPGMLLDNDVVTDGQAEASTLSGWFSREEGIEQLLPLLGWNTCAVVTYPNLYRVAQVFCSGC